MVSTILDAATFALRAGSGEKEKLVEERILGLSEEADTVRLEGSVEMSSMVKLMLVKLVLAPLGVTLFSLRVSTPLLMSEAGPVTIRLGVVLRPRPQPPVTCTRSPDWR